MVRPAVKHRLLLDSGRNGFGQSPALRRFVIVHKVFMQFL